LPGGDREIGDSTAAVARKRSANNNERLMFSVRFILRCFKEDKWNNELVVGSSTDNNFSTEEEDIVAIHYQATTGEDTAD
jgi:hypothetical protein